MKLTFLSSPMAKSTLIDLTRDCREMRWAVAWATPNALTREALKHQEKIKKLVIGTHFYQTDPALLKQFVGIKSAVVKPPTGALFHPKVYLFSDGSWMSAVVGSHNLTKGAWEGKNIEASVLMHGQKDHELFEELKNFVDKEWKGAERIDDDFLYSYELQYKANRERHISLKTFHRIKKPPDGTLDWPDFVASVQADEHHSLDGRLAILESARRLFDEKHSLARMNLSERKAIAGTLGKRERGPGDLDWGWFGTMFGQGDFKSLVNQGPAQLSRALNQIPLRGPISMEHYNAFVENFREAFRDAAHKGGVATASRLLAMKRPDQFVAVNGPNRQGLCDANGFAYTTLRLDNYWERIIVPTWLSPWWQHPRPRSQLEGRIWDNRAALLDCIYYEPSTKR